MNDIRDLDRVGEVYNALKEMRMHQHPMVDALVRRVWDMRENWLVSAYVPEHDQIERFAWIQSLVLLEDSGLEDSMFG